MKKSDLVAGKHVVQMRNGDNYLVLESEEYGLILSKNESWCRLNTHKKDLTFPKKRKLDIVKVGLIDFVTLDDLQNDNRIEWIWERKKLQHNVGDCFKGKHGVYVKIKKVENNKYIVDYINEYGEYFDISIIEWDDEDFESEAFIPYTPIERPEIQVDDVVRFIGEDCEAYKTGDLKRIIGITKDWFNLNKIGVYNTVWRKDTFHQKWVLVDKNTLTLEELKNLGFEVEVK